MYLITFMMLTCGRVLPPTPANDTCVYWMPSPYGFEINKYLYNNGLSFSLHGWWPREISSGVTALTFSQFQNVYDGKMNFLDVKEPFANVSCFQYREYKKHGAHSGYTFSEWYNSISQCINRKEFTYVHQCHYNEITDLNCILTTTSTPMQMVGCKSGRPFTFCKVN